MAYNTKQKQEILDLIKNQKKEFTVKDIYNKLNSDVGLTTIYRVIDKLLKENILNKYIDNDNITHYEYLEKCEHDNHFYLKCDKCKSVIHIDCDCINDLSKHILKDHQFTLNKEKIIIGGICKNCMKEGK